MVLQALKLFILAAVLGLAVNLVSPNKIPYIGTYRELSEGDGPIIPPSAMKGDPPFVSLSDAENRWSFKEATFVDARNPEEFVCGTIPGSLNLPFEELPEEGLVEFIDEKLNHIAKDAPLVVFCSGEECDLSLHLARNLQQFGYTSLEIFFGGAREWEKAGLDMERREKCE